MPLARLLRTMPLARLLRTAAAPHAEHCTCTQRASHATCRSRACSARLLQHIPNTVAPLPRSRTVAQVGPRAAGWRPLEHVSRRRDSAASHPAGPCSWSACKMSMLGQPHHGRAEREVSVLPATKHVSERLLKPRSTSASVWTSKNHVVKRYFLTG